MIFCAKEKEDGEEISLHTLNFLSTLSMTSPSTAVRLGQGESNSKRHHLNSRTAQVWPNYLLQRRLPHPRRTPIPGSERGETLLRRSARVQVRVMAAAATPGKAVLPRGYSWAFRGVRRY